MTSPPSYGLAKIRIAFWIFDQAYRNLHLLIQEMDASPNPWCYRIISSSNPGPQAPGRPCYCMDKLRQIEPFSTTIDSMFILLVFDRQSRKIQDGCPLYLPPDKLLPFLLNSEISSLVISPAVCIGACWFNLTVLTDRSPPL